MAKKLTYNASGFGNFGGVQNNKKSSVTRNEKNIKRVNKAKNAVVKVATAPAKKQVSRAKKATDIWSKAVTKVSEKAMGKRGFANYAEVEARNKTLKPSKKWDKLKKKQEQRGMSVLIGKYTK